MTIFVYNAGGTLVAEYSTVLATTQQVSYLTQDHLGSPRVITNENGTVKDRKDYSAFGEESTSSQRSSNSEYTAADQLRKNYTGYEKDSESGLEFAQARYYNPTHGRFTSVDPMTGSASIKNPQTFNRYSYVLNSPYKFSDPLGLIPSTTGACGSGCPWTAGGSMGLIGLYSSNGESIEIRQVTQQPEPPAPPQIKVEGVTLITRTPKLDKGGNRVILNGEQVYEEAVLAVGSAAQGFGGFEINISKAVALLNIGETVYLKVDLGIVEGRNENRAVFDNNATSNTGADPSRKPQEDTKISGDGKKMTVYLGLTKHPDGVPVGPIDGTGRDGLIGSITLRVQASYVDQYDSTTNKILVNKKIEEPIRLSLKNLRHNPFLKQPN